jgi:RimJ/RimL family protein N-acetyltransferase
MNDREVTQFLMIDRPMTILSEEQWIEKLGDNEKNIVLGIATHTGQLIGTMGLHGIDHKTGSATTGAQIGEGKFRGKGYGTEAKMLFLHYAFMELNLRKIRSRAFAFNERSIAYLKKTGYEVEGVMKQEVFKNGEFHDVVLLAVFRDTFIPLWEKYQASQKKKQ